MLFKTNDKSHFGLNDKPIKQMMHLLTLAYKEQRKYTTMLFLLLLICFGQGFAQEPLDSTDHEFASTLDFLETCTPLGKITDVHVINYESTSRAFLKIEQADALYIAPHAADLINQIGAVIYQQYKTSSIFEKLESLLTKPWVEGECSGGVNNVGMGNLNFITLFDREMLTFEMFESTFMEVNGRTRWRSEAEVLSGFSLAVALMEQESEEGDDCCTRPAGAHAFSTQHPIHDENTYKQEIGAMYAIPLGSYLPTSPSNGQVIIDNEWDILYAPEIPELNCDTQINGRSLDEENQLSSSNLPTVYLAGNNLYVEGLKKQVNYQAQLYDITGRLLQQNPNLLSDEVIFSLSSAQYSPGIYLLRLAGSDNQILTQKIYLP